MFVEQWKDIADIIGIQDLMTYESGPQQDTSKLKNIDKKLLVHAICPKLGCLYDQMVMYSPAVQFKR